MLEVTALSKRDGAENISSQPMQYCLALPLCWTFGLICGVLLFLYAGTPVVSLMRGISDSSVSIVSLLTIGFVPFLLTAFAFFLTTQQLFFLICFCKACLFSFVAVGISVAFSSAGWLIRRIVLFYNSVWCVMLYFLWHRILYGRKGFWLVAAAAGLFTGCIAIHIISPFMACLIDY